LIDFKSTQSDYYTIVNLDLLKSIIQALINQLFLN